MAGPEDFQPRAKARAKTWAAGIDAARRRASFALPEGLANSADAARKRLKEWALAEVAPGRLLPWLAVAFGFGIVLYFTAEHEPAWWAAVSLALVTSITAFLSRRHPFAFPLTLGFASVAAGFTIATFHTSDIAHPVLQSPITSVSLSGFVETREARERSDRIVVRIKHLEGAQLTETPTRVRLAIRKGSAPPVGSFVELKAHLSPPLAPLLPGGYDFARDMYFQNIGASGYALGKIKVVAPPVVPRVWLRYAAFLDSARATIDKRIHTELTGDRGSIASALITGTRDAISAPVNDAMYISSLAHVLSISGYHMAVVAGIVFFFIRASLALIPSLASRRPIKKWAAFGALIAAAMYLLLSGSEVATQRSFIMIAIVLIGVMVDRPALTFRTLTVAALGVLLLAPQAVVHPSFQMSFAATLALIAGYQHGLPWRANADTSLGARVALWGLREIVGLVLASLVAGLATTPYAAYHFHRLAPYGVLANLLAMPVVSMLVMPMGILGVLTIPFGFDAIFWRLMGNGIDWMIVVVEWVAKLPGAVGRIQAFDVGALLLATAGLLVICLLRTPLRWCGAVIAFAAVFWATITPRPDILISSDGQTAALRTGNGALSLLHSARDTFALKEWLAADADSRTPQDASLRDGTRCDAIGCIGKLKDGRLVSMALAQESFAEDCQRAAVVISPRAAPEACAAILIDRPKWLVNGAMALRWNGDRFEESDVRPSGYDRPWARKYSVSASGTKSQTRSKSVDAMPRVEEREADD